MSHREAKIVKERLLETSVTMMEAAVLIDMAQALRAGSTIYSWGHDRLAPVILKRPGSVSAKRALSGRIVPALIRKGLIRKVADAHRGRNAEYDLIVLHDDWETGMGTGLSGTHSTPGMGTGMGTGFDPEWVPVLGAMGTGLSGTPATVTATHTPTGSASADSDAPASSTTESVLSPSSTPPGGTRKNRWSYLPEGFTPNEKHAQRARDMGVNLADEFERFRDYHLANGSRKADWGAELRLWLDRSRSPKGRSRSTGRAAGDLMKEVLAIKLPGEDGYGEKSVA